ncbi:hypothetical protein [Streptomyces sp. NPDC050585]|uniref:hypothetical protein n=1 Tax=Streptomyces sp. NPDC050585 TaxID=3365632 RepID=UPI0037A31043
MVKVLVSPSYGSAEARRHWRDTLDQEVDFQAPDLRSRLTGDEAAELDRLHPEGRARFWGARPTHDKKMATVVSGDVVLFTGEKQVRAIGEVGVIFRNAEFAAALWPPRDGAEGWHTVYSLTAFERTDIPYGELNGVIGYNSNHTYPGQLLLTGDRARAVCDAFLISPRRVPRPRDADPAVRAVRVAAAEELRATHLAYDRPGARQFVRRREGALVRAYREALGLAEGKRYYCPSGITDLYVEAPVAELVEAKGGTTRTHVRQALAQLLDYAPHCPTPDARLTALFPAPLDHTDTAYLHRYGIDCVYQTAEGTFERLPAPEESRRAMTALIRAEA